MTHDIIIIGGAMAGVTLALALSHQTQGKIRLAIVEKQPVKLHCQHGFDARCIALSAGSCQRFEQITLPDQQNLWQQIQPISTPIQQIHVSDKGHSGIVEFSASEFQLPQLGAVVELSQMGNLLLQAIKQYPNIEYIAPMDIEHIEQQQSAVKIQLKNHRTLQAKLLIGADGSQSQVAQAVGITQRKEREYQQTAIITNVCVQKPHQNRAFERFTKEGPVALLPMKENLMSLVWCVKEAESIMALNDTEFLTQLQQRFGWRLGKFQACGKRFAYPLNLYRAEQSIHHRTVLIGNAAQTLHPVAGQGFNLGIRDVMDLAQLIAPLFLQQKDIGEATYLRQYADIRKPDQNQIIQLTDGLLSLFANSLIPLQIGRNLGLMAMAQSQILRQHFAKPTLGWQ